MNAIRTPLLSFDVIGSNSEFLTLALPDGFRLPLAAPEFEIDGARVSGELSGVTEASAPRDLPQGAREYTFAGPLRARPDLVLRLVVRLADDSPVVRFRFELAPAPGAASVRLTKSAGHDALAYFGANLASLPDTVEVRLGEFDQISHAYRLSETRLDERDFNHGVSALGPLLTAVGGGHAALFAYEHGSMAPHPFLEFALAPDRSFQLRAAQGNYWNGRVLTAEQPFESLWFDVAVLPGDRDALAHAFRQFVLHRMSANAASRRPNIYYNSWACQERDRWWNNSGAYLATMNEERILADIDVAHRMGVDVFVIDTGWYEKTGDWRVSTKRFPHGLDPVRRKLEGYGMKLGLWFSPTEAAVSSDILARNRAFITERDGEKSHPHSVWETEESQNICLASDYWRDFADSLIEISRTWGVTYFKWDAIGQYSCDAAGHAHGGADVPREERMLCYAFEQVRYMAKVVDRLCEACPEAIVDFDVTEGWRSFGLAFLAAGKFFSSNNGPYFQNFDARPQDIPGWCNVFTNPGPARAWTMRPTLEFDRWIPSVLLLGHYIPDAPRDSQLLNIASLILGQNGIWGDLQNMQEDGIALFHEALSAYKQVRDDITEADPVRRGRIAGNPEIHEKIAPSGAGAVALFCTEPGSYVYATKNACGPVLWKSEGIEVSYDAQDHATLRMECPCATARLVFFSNTTAR